MKSTLITCLVSILFVAGCGTKEVGHADKEPFKSNELAEKHLFSNEKLTLSELSASSGTSRALTVDTETNEQQPAMSSSDNLGNEPKNYHKKSETGFNTETTPKQKSQNDNKNKENRNSTVQDNEEDQSSDQKEQQDVSHEATFLTLLNKYNHMFEKIKPDVNYDHFSEEHIGYKFKTIKTKDQLYAKFSGFMTKKVASIFWSERVSQGKDGLYLIPMDGLMRFNKDNPYTIKQINSKEYKLIHKHVSELYGTQMMIFTFTKVEGNWMITDYSYKLP